MLITSWALPITIETIIWEYTVTIYLFFTYTCNIENSLPNTKNTWIKVDFDVLFIKLFAIISDENMISYNVSFAGLTRRGKVIRIENPINNLAFHD